MGNFGRVQKARQEIISDDLTLPQDTLAGGSRMTPDIVHHCTPTQRRTEVQYCGLANTNNNQLYFASSRLVVKARDRRMRRVRKCGNWVQDAD